VLIFCWKSILFWLDVGLCEIRFTKVFTSVLTPISSLFFLQVFPKKNLSRKVAQVLSICCGSGQQLQFVSSWQEEASSRVHGGREV